jgi:hypothetical protein
MMIAAWVLGGCLALFMLYTLEEVFLYLDGWLKDTPRFQYQYTIV